MQMPYTYKPFRFFLITFLGTWIPGFIAAYFSYQTGMEGFQLLLMFAGLLAPCVTALSMIYHSHNKELKNDFWDRLRLSAIRLKLLPVILLLMPAAVFLATAISLLFGKSTDQFALSKEFKIMNGHAMLSVLILFLAPILEELGWRGYGVDSLRANFNLFSTSLLFACLWALWHVPLFFIHGYYQHELWNASIMYVFNFFVSVLPVTVLMNWIYYKNNRSILAAILFHFMLNLFSVLIQTEQFTKCIITVLLLVVSAIIIATNKKFFFSENVKAMQKKENYSYE